MASNFTAQREGRLLIRARGRKEGAGGERDLGLMEDFFFFLRYSREPRSTSHTKDSEQYRGPN